MFSFTKSLRSLNSLLSLRSLNSLNSLRSLNSLPSLRSLNSLNSLSSLKSLSSLNQPPLHPILHPLPNQLLNPRQRLIRPTLRMESHHYLIGKTVFFYCLYNIIRRMKDQPLSYPRFLLRYFISQAYFPVVPSSAGIG